MGDCFPSSDAVCYSQSDETKDAIVMRCFLAGLLIVSSSGLAQTEVPHVFADGQIISAESFNENFDYLEDAIDDQGWSVQGGANASYGSGAIVVRTADGTIMGQKLGVWIDGGDAYVIWTQQGGLRLGTLSYGGEAERYIARWNFFAWPHYYVSADCSGTPYGWDTSGGLLLSYIDRNEELLVPAGDEQTVTVRSRFQGIPGACESFDPTEATVNPLAPSGITVDLSKMQAPVMFYKVP